MTDDQWAGGSVTGQFERASEITVFRDVRHFGVGNLNRVGWGLESPLEMQVNSFISMFRILCFQYL